MRWVMNGFLLDMSSEEFVWNSLSELDCVAVEMKDTICTVILITQPMLCSNISATKGVITHVTIKSLAGIPGK